MALGSERCFEPYYCPLCASMGDEFIRFARRNAHLVEYIHEWARGEGASLGLPRFVRTLSRELGGQKTYNYIYPVGEPIFIHVYKASIDVYGTYHPIEPRLPEDKRELVRRVEELIATIAKEIPEDTDRVQALNTLFEKVVVKEEGAGLKMVKNKLVVSPELYELLRYELLREYVGFGDLEPFLRDPYLEDISCNGVGPIFVVHKIFGTLKSTIGFDSYEELDVFIMRMCEKIGKPVSVGKPIVDAALPDGSRLNAVYGRDLSRRGSNFTIRKFPKVPLSVTELIKLGTIDARIAAYLWMLIDCDMSMFICGETASGKTTTLNAISAFIKPTAKIVSIEETPEVVLPHPNWVSEVTRPSETSPIDLYDLLKNALRQRPDYIIVGEIRGREGNVAFQAMQTGHPVLSTFHASDMEKLLQRLTGDPINIPPAYINNLNVAIFQNLIIDSRGNFKRRATSVNEIIGYDPVEDVYNFIEVFYWDPVEDKHVFRGIGNSYLLEHVVARRRGLPPSQVIKVYDELEVRTAIIERMVELGVMGFYDVYSVISTLHGMPVEEAYWRVDEICQAVLGKH